MKEAEAQKAASEKLAPQSETDGGEGESEAAQPPVQVAKYL